MITTARFKVRLKPDTLYLDNSEQLAQLAQLLMVHNENLCDPRLADDDAQAAMVTVTFGL